jgi:hypothetical protein
MSSFVRRFQGFHSTILLLPAERSSIRGNLALHMDSYPVRLPHPPRFRLRFRWLSDGEVDHHQTGAEAPAMPFNGGNMNERV